MALRLGYPNCYHTTKQISQQITYNKFHTPVISTHFFGQVQILFFFAHCIVLKVRLETNC